MRQKGLHSHLIFAIKNEISTTNKGKSDVKGKICEGSNQYYYGLVGMRVYCIECLNSMFWRALESNFLGLKHTYCLKILTKGLSGLTPYLGRARLRSP